MPVFTLTTRNRANSSSCACGIWVVATSLSSESRYTKTSTFAPGLIAAVR